MPNGVLTKKLPRWVTRSRLPTGVRQPGRVGLEGPLDADQRKANREMQVFLEFLQKSELPIKRDSVENRMPPEPDILCRHKEQGFVAFELVEL